MSSPVQRITGLQKNKHCRSRTQFVMLRQCLRQTWGVNVTLKSKGCVGT